MSAFFIATVDIRDRDKFAEYSEKVAVTFEQYGGTRLIRGIKSAVLVGEADNNAVGVFKFADEAALNTWYNSPEYQAIVPLRDAACKMSIVAYADLD